MPHHNRSGPYPERSRAQCVNEAQMRPAGGARLPSTDPCSVADTDAIVRRQISEEPVMKITAVRLLRLSGTMRTEGAALGGAARPADRHLPGIPRARRLRGRRPDRSRAFPPRTAFPPDRNRRRAVRHRRPAGRIWSLPTSPSGCGRSSSARTRSHTRSCGTRCTGSWCTAARATRCWRSARSTARCGT